MTTLPKTFDPAEAEGRLYAAWEASGAFAPEAALARDPDAEPFCMVIPPPNVTGSLHIGHALNTTLQDVLARFHRVRGRAVPPFGRSPCRQPPTPPPPPSAWRSPGWARSRATSTCR